MFVVTWENGRNGIWGPFKTADQAVKWARRNFTMEGWIIRPLTKPD
jgi:hypothetical protein